MTKKREFDPADIAAALVKHKGDLVDAADEVGCTVRTIYNYKDKYSVVADAMDETRKRTHNYVRNKLMDLIDAGNVAATIFWLKTQGKDEGWVERTELTGADGRAVELEHKGKTHGDAEHLAAVLATLVRAGAVALPTNAGGDEAQDDSVHPA